MDLALALDEEAFGTPTPAPTNRLLSEDGDRLLSEGGDFLQTE